MKRSVFEIDMCNGPLLGKIIYFALPLIFSGVLQLTFNAADMVVVGRFAGGNALAAVGSTASLNNLLINLFIGLSVGANVLVARFHGAGNDKETSETVHTALVVSVISGVILCFVGLLAAKPLLTLMGTPDEVLEQATLYMRITFAGMPVMLLYNFGSSILRAVGDTLRPLFFLTIAGIVNVVLNLIFVIGLGMDVEGVALATVISQCISAGLLVFCLMKTEGSHRLILANLRIRKKILIQMIKIGLPAGIQGALFSISNVLIQSSINSFGPVAMAGNTATVNLEGFVYTAMNAFHQTAVSFTGQNMGAQKYARVKRILIICLVLVSVVGIGMCSIGLYFGRFLISIYTKGEPEATAFGLTRMKVIFTTYFTCGVMDVLVGSIRGMGRSILPMIVSLLGACGLRIVWIYTIFQWNRTLPVLYYSYPISWVATALVHLICFVLVYKSVIKRTNRYL